MPVGAVALDVDARSLPEGSAAGWGRNSVVIGSGSLIAPGDPRCEPGPRTLTVSTNRSNRNAAPQACWFWSSNGWRALT